MAKKKNKKSEEAKAKDAAGYFDIVVMSNIYADYHRILMDRMDCDFDTPASANELDPAEITRRTAYGFLSDMADSVALKWKDLQANPEAQLDAGTPLEARQQAIQGFRQTLEAERADQQASVRTEVLEYYEDRNKVGSGLTDEILAEAVEKGLLKGKEVLDSMMEWLEQDEPSMNYPQAHEQRLAAIDTCWEIVAKHIKTRIPEEQEPTKDLASLYRIAYLDVAQNALYQAFNLATVGMREPVEGTTDEPRLFAGSIMTELNIPQPFIDPGPDADEAAAMKEEGFTPPPQPMNGEVAESPQAVQIRELTMVFNAIGEDLLYGELRRDVKRRFKELAELAFEPDAPEFITPELWALSLNEPKPALDLKVGKKVKAAAQDEADEMIRDIVADMVVEMKAQDGWVLDRSKLQTTDEKMALSPPERFTMMPCTARLQ